MKKFFYDDILYPQPLSKEAAVKLFGVSEDKIEDTLKAEQFIVSKTIKTKTKSIQICINTAAIIENNSYLFLVFDLDDNLLEAFSVPSHTVCPPVWDRLFGGLDYLDWLSIQYRIQSTFPEDLFEISYETDGFSFYLTQEPDAFQRMQRGEKYGNICLFAERRLDLVENAKKLCNEWYKK